MARTSSTSTRTSTGRTAAAKRATPARRTAAQPTAAKRTTTKRTAPSKTSTKPTTARWQVEASASDAQERAASTLRSQLDERSNQFGDQLAGTATDVRQIAGKLRDQDNDPAARIADLAADRIDQAADYLSTNSAETLLTDVEDLARSKPWLTAGAAIIVGFAASRALSASSRKRRGGGYVNVDAGADFDGEDADEAYPVERSGSRS